MRTNQSYLFVLLLASFSISCTADCPSPDPYFDTGYRKCAKLYNMLETALLANPENLYQLQDSFFPSSSSEPTYVLVTFTLNKHHHQTCWTSSVLLKSLDPSVLIFLQIQLLDLLLVKVDPVPGLFPFSSELLFNLTVNSTVSDYSRYINSTLQELTTWLKVYASMRWSHSADLKYKGYNCAPDVTVTNILICTAVVTVALTTIALLMAAPKLYQKITSRVERGNQWYSFFWAASFIASLCNIAVVSYEEMVGLAMALGPVPQDMSQWYSVKAIAICLLILLDFLAAICIIPKSPEFPIPRLAYILSFPLCCTWCCCSWCCCRRCRHSKQLHSKWIQSLALTNLLIFTQLFTLSASPTIFVFPAQTLAAIVSFIAAIFCVTALIALLIRSIGQITCSGGCRRDDCYHGFMQVLLIPMVTIFLAAMVIFLYIYIKLFATGVALNQVGGFIVSFLPSAILTIIGWFVTKGKFIEQMFPQESNPTRNNSQVDPPTERTPLNASLNV